MGHALSSCFCCYAKLTRYFLVAQKEPGLVWSGLVLFGLYSGPGLQTGTMARVGAACLVPLLPLLALVFGVSGVGGAFVIPGALQDDCSQQGMNCSSISSNCWDPAWILSHKYTPSGPDKLDLKISYRADPRGNLLPVINASWTLKDDGSIMFLKASELQVVVVSTNQHICVRYSFNNQLSMRSPSGHQWKLSSDVLGVEPGQSYRVSVENIPKAELDHRTFSINRQISVPDCSDPEMKLTQPCIDRGSLWSPNISVSKSGAEVLTVEFSPHPLSDRYFVLCRCDPGPKTWNKTLYKASSRLRASFPLDSAWVRTCCRFHIEIKSFFSGCGNDCSRRKIIQDFCSKPSPAPPAGSWKPLPVALGVSAVLLLTVALGVCVVIICRRKDDKEGQGPDMGALLQEHRLEEHPTLLLIYSRDHPLFLDVVVKLAAFLQAQCGIMVLLDLLDSTVVSQVGLIRWLELQRNKLGPNDKILVLCSRGVHHKWRAMCGQGHMRHQPDDMIGPFLSLFLSDMHQPGSMGRYIAAYFSEIGLESDVPSFFDIAVKYKLMKHFEELCFRVLDREKYEPQKVNHIEGIGPDEYFRCPSGHQLQKAIEKFQMFQVENPDWFEKAEEVNELCLLIEESQQLPLIKECVPIVREGCTILTNDVLGKKNINNFYLIAPELNKKVSLSENEPVLCPAAALQNPSVLELLPDRCPNVEIFQSDVIPVIHQEEVEAAEWRVEQNEEGEAGSLCQKSLSVEMAKIEVILETRGESKADTNRSEQAGASAGQNEAGVAAFPWSKADTSGSDQGYSSKAWTEPDSEDLRALLQLQQELMSNICPWDTQ